MRMGRAAVLGFTATAMLAFAPAGASAAKFVIEDWNGVEGNWHTNPGLDFKGWQAVNDDPLAFALRQNGIEEHGLYGSSRPHGLARARAASRVPNRHCSRRCERRLTRRARRVDRELRVCLSSKGSRDSRRSPRCRRLLAEGPTAEWRYTPPGTSTIYKAEYAPANLILVGCLNEGFRTKSGAWEQTVNGRPGKTLDRSDHPTACGSGVVPPPVSTHPGAPGEPPFCVACGPATGQLPVEVQRRAPGEQVFCAETSDPCGLAGSPIENSAVFGIEQVKPVSTPFAAYLPGVRLYETDYVEPYFTGATNSLQGWVREGEGAITASATDTGLGVKAIRLTQVDRAGGRTERAQSSPCTGDRNHRCPATWNAAEPVYAPAFRYSVDELPEGIDHFGVKAISVVEHESNPQGAMDETTVPVTKVDRQPPTGLVASGELAQSGLYVNGQGTKPITLTATDNLSGIRKLSLEDEGRGVLASVSPAQCVFAPLREDQCPLSASHGFSIETSTMPEGANHLRIIAEDLAGNVAYGAPWTVYVDRTAPAFHEPFEASAVETRKTGSSVLSWSSAVDPPLTDGSSGSGLAFYSYRYSVNGGAFTGWAQTTAQEATVTGLSVGEAVAIEVAATDKVGNASAAESATTTVEGDEGEESCLDPAVDSPAKLAECGDSEYGPSSVSAMPHGGMESHYTMAHGEVVTFITPPESFDAATASPAELEEYGIPTAPPAGSPEYALWRQMVDNLPYEPPPEAVIETNLSNAPATQERSSGNWSGYLDQANYQRYDQATAYLYPPKSVTQSCPGATMSMWAGLGGWFNHFNLSQDGFNVEAGTRNYPAWWEVLPQKETFIKERPTGHPFVASKGAYFKAETKLIGSHDRQFFMYNYATHKHEVLREPGIGENDHSTADFIAAERLTIEIGHKGYLTPLLRFSELEVEGYSEGQSLSTFPNYRVEMFANGSSLAQPTGLTGPGANFGDSWINCGQQELG